MKYIVLVFSLFLTIANATVYRSVDSQGNVVFSDVPSENSERLELPELPTYSPAEISDSILNEANESDENQDDENIEYTISVVSPEYDQTFWDNIGDITITAELSPALSQDHRIIFSMDGKALSEPQSSLTYTAKGLDRGSHIIVVSVVDGEGNVLKRSKSILFHLRKHSVN